MTIIVMAFVAHLFTSGPLDSHKQSYIRISLLIRPQKNCTVNTEKLRLERLFPLPLVLSSVDNSFPAVLCNALHAVAYALFWHSWSAVVLGWFAKFPFNDRHMHVSLFVSQGGTCAWFLHSWDDILTSHVEGFRAKIILTTTHHCVNSSCQRNLELKRILALVIVILSWHCFASLRLICHFESTEHWFFYIDRMI